MNAATTSKKLTKIQSSVLEALRSEGAELVEEWGCTKGVTGTAKTRFYYQAWIKNGSGYSVRRVARRTVEALSAHLTTTAASKGLRVSRAAG